MGTPVGTAVSAADLSWAVTKTGMWQVDGGGWIDRVESTSEALARPASSSATPAVSHSISTSFSVLVSSKETT